MNEQEREFLKIVTLRRSRQSYKGILKITGRRHLPPLTVRGGHF